MSELMNIENLSLPETGKRLSGKIPRGITYLKGQNGSGKTVLLDVLSGLRSIPKGANINHQLKRIIYMRQNFLFNARLTVKEYLRFIVGLSNTSIEQFNQFLEQYYPVYKLNNILQKKLGLLSGGERQELYLLSILSLERELYLLDEPFASVDTNKFEILCQIIERIHLEKGSHFIISSHTALDMENINVLEFNDFVIDTN